MHGRTLADTIFSLIRYSLTVQVLEHKPGSGHHLSMLTSSVLVLRSKHYISVSTGSPDSSFLFLQAQKSTLRLMMEPRLCMKLLRWDMRKLCRCFCLRKLMPTSLEKRECCRFISLHREEVMRK